ncbi:MAG: D-cysteine desulfhydrase family protein [Pseudomonadota bacterium]
MPDRFPILTGPTPLVPAPRLSRELGIELSIKRDDVAGPSLGGNKARQLEYYFGQARAEAADTILITGARQSNYVRLAASVARMLGMDAVVQLEDRVPQTTEIYKRSGNVLLDRLFGVEIMTYPDGEDEAGADRALFDRADALRAAGRKPYVIPLGEGHPPLGALGYVDAGGELAGQDSAFDVVVVASGSGATHAGLLAGLRGAGHASRVIGSCVRRDAAAQTARIGRVIDRMRPLTPAAERVGPSDILLWDGALAPGYGKIGPAALGAMRRMAEAEGLLLDPVYTAKAFAAVIALVEDGSISRGSRVCFVHTGGLAGLFAYEDVLTDMLSEAGQTV